MAGVLLGSVVAGCVHPWSGQSPLESVRVAPSVDTRLEHPAMDGRCTITTGEDVSAYTYEAGRLTLSTRTDTDVRTTFTYDGPQLTAIVREIGGRVLFRREFSYDATGRLAVHVSLSFREDRTLLVEDLRYTFEYDAAGRASTATVRYSGAPGLSDRVCRFGYDDQGRLESQSWDPRLEGDDPDGTTYSYDTMGLLSEVRTPYRSFRMHHTAEGQLARLEFIAESGRVLATHTTIRDSAGREVERVYARPGQEDVVSRITFEGDFGADAECGTPPPAPPGLSDHAPSLWFEISH